MHVQHRSSAAKTHRAARQPTSTQQCQNTPTLHPTKPNKDYSKRKPPPAPTELHMSHDRLIHQNDPVQGKAKGGRGDMQNSASPSYLCGVPKLTTLLLHHVAMYSVHVQTCLHTSFFARSFYLRVTYQIRSRSASWYTIRHSFATSAASSHTSSGERTGENVRGDLSVN